MTGYIDECIIGGDVLQGALEAAGRAGLEPGVCIANEYEALTAILWYVRRGYALRHFYDKEASGCRVVGIKDESASVIIVVCREDFAVLWLEENDSTQRPGS